MNEKNGFDNLYGIPVKQFHDWFRGYAEEILDNLRGRKAMNAYNQDGSGMFKDLMIAFNLEESGDTAGINMLRDAFKSGEDRMRELIAK